MARPKKNLEKSIKEEMPEFFDSCQSLSQEEIDSRLAQLVKDRNAVDESEGDDVELDEAKKLKSELGAPYRDAKAAIKLKSDYLCLLLSQRGAA